jgi:hypothetical protein
MMTSNEIWLTKYTKIQQNYVVYGCFNKKCAAELKIYSKPDIMQPNVDAPFASAVFESGTQYRSSMIIEVFRHGEHAEHDVEDFEKRKAYKERHGIVFVYHT